MSGQIPCQVRAKEYRLHLVARLLQQPNIRLAEVWLFGSKARGDFESDSDLDLLLVLDDADWTIRDQVHLMAARVSLEYGVLINTHILSRDRWAEMTRHRSTLWRYVQRDGIPLTQELSPV
jgi:predicted nucleotidyltransferase